MLNKSKSTAIYFILVVITLFPLTLYVHAGVGATLNVSISAPPNLTQFTQRQAFNITSKVKCQVSNCNIVYATPRYNITGSLPNTPINSSATGLTPLAIEISMYALNRWNRTYDISGADEAVGIATDVNDSVYIVGDENANADIRIMKLNSTGKSIWNRTFNPGGTDTAGDVVLDRNGNIYVIGNTASDIYIMKLSNAGNSIWNRTWAPSGSALTDTGRGIALDNNSNVYIVGRTNANVFFAKLNNTGGSIWNRTYNPAGSDDGTGIVLDKGGNVYIAAQRTDANFNMFIIKVNNTGGSIWNRTYNPGTTDRAKGITIDNQRNIYVIGDHDSATTLMKINSTGGSIWNRTLNLAGSDIGRGITIDKENNLYVVGDFNGNVYISILKLDVDGFNIWNKTYNPGTTDVGNSITIDKNNDIYIAGGATNTNADWHIMKFDNSLSYNTCGNLTINAVCTFKWRINATSLGGYKIGVYYNSTGLAAVNVTDNLTIRVGAPQAGADSCTPPPSGDWIITDICFKSNTNIALSGAGAKIIINTGGKLICDRCNVTNLGRRANRTILGATAEKLVRKGATMV